jgi:OMF family outer membrane factor
MAAARSAGGRAFLLASAFLALATRVEALPRELQPLTLDEALRMADERNADLAALRARAEAQDLRRTVAARMNWPRLSVVSDVSGTDAASRVFAEKLDRGALQQDDLSLVRLNDPDSTGHLRTALALELPVDLAGAVRARTRAEESGARALAAQVVEARGELRLRVTEAYARAALAAAALQATQSALQGARSREDALAARVSQGAALHGERLRARTRTRQREAEVARAQGDARASLASLARLLGTDGVQYRPAGPIPIPAEDDETVESWLARARSTRALNLVAAERRGAAEWARRAEERARLPMLAGYASVFDDRWSGASRQSFAVGASIRWTLDPAQRRRVSLGHAEERVAGLEQRATAARVDMEVEEAWARLTAAREAVHAATGGTEEGREALRVVRERRAAGLATLTDELETEAASLGAELEELRARAELALAEAGLRRAAGVL